MAALDDEKYFRMVKLNRDYANVVDSLRNHNAIDLRRLIRDGADVHYIPENKRPHLIVATWRGNVAGVKALLQEGGVDPNAVDQFGWTALMCAAARPKGMRTKIIRLLLRHNADYTIKSTAKFDDWPVGTTVHDIMRVWAPELQELLPKEAPAAPPVPPPVPPTNI